MDKKTIVSTLYLKEGKAVKGPDDFSSAGDLFTMAKMYNDSGVDKIIVYDLSDSDREHEKNVHTIKCMVHIF